MIRLVASERSFVAFATGKMRGKLGGNTRDFFRQLDWRKLCQLRTWFGLEPSWLVLAALGYSVRLASLVKSGNK